VYVFDVLEKDGKDLLKEPLLERRKLIPSDGVFRLAESRIVHFPEERAKIFEYFREVLERKYEGLIIKGCQDPYYTNDSRSHWKKLKRGFASNRDARISKVELDLIVMGANRGQGSKNSRHFTSYLLGASYQGKILPVSNVGSGLTEEMMAVIAKYVEEQGLRTE
jgi:ATP-dependent DNA ligase